jgi:hypothetical protein
MARPLVVVTSQQMRNERKRNISGGCVRVAYLLLHLGEKPESCPTSPRIKKVFRLAHGTGCLFDLVLWLARADPSRVA